MCGCMFVDKYLIIDEVQNLMLKQMKMFVMCVGFGMKIVCFGNIVQIDMFYLIEGSLGLIYVVDCFKGWGYSGYVIFVCGECLWFVDYVLDIL